jgi:hypothetical protein
MSPATSRPAAELDPRLNTTGGGRTQDPPSLAAPVAREGDKASRQASRPHPSPDGTPASPRRGRAAAGAKAGSGAGRGTLSAAAGHPLPAAQAAIAAAMSEDRGPDSLEAHLRRLMKGLGLTGFHVEKSLDVEKNRKNVSVKGWPDWTIRGPRGVLFRELKSQRGRVAPEQQEWLDALAAAGMDAGVWRPASLLSGAIAAELAGISAWRTRRGTRCVCDQYGSCPQGCAMCRVCGGAA